MDSTNMPAMTPPTEMGVNSLANSSVTTSAVSSAELVLSAMAALMWRARRKMTFRSSSMVASFFSLEVDSRWVSRLRARSTMRASRCVSMLSVIPTPEIRNTGPSASWMSFATFSVCRSICMGRKSATIHQLRTGQAVELGACRTV